MNDLEDEPITGKAGMKEETARSPWVLSDFQPDMLTQQTLLRKEITDIDQVIAAHNDKLMMLDKKLDEVLHMGQDLASGFENVSKLIEKQGQENAELPNMTKKYLEVFVRLSEVVEQQGHKVAELTNMKKELAEDSLNLSTLVEQHSCQLVGRSDIIGEKDVIDSPLEKEEIEMHESATVYDESSDIAALKLSIDSVIARLKQDHEKTINRYKTKLEALNEAFVKKTEDLVQFHEQIENQKLEISNLALHVENAKAKDEEIDSLELLLKLANKKLEERLEQMEQMGKMTSRVDQQLTQLITDVKVDGTRQSEDIQTVVDSVQTMMSSLTEIRDHIKHVPDTRKTNENTIVMKTDLPLSDFLTRLQLLYKPMTERLSAKSVAVELFQNDALSLAELQKVQCAKTAVDAAEYLLNRLLDVHNDASYCCFLNALKATNQEHILLWLTDDDGANVIAAVEGHKAATGSAKAGKDSSANVLTDVKFTQTNPARKPLAVDLVFKCVIVGGICSGKTSFLHRFVKNERLHHPSVTIGADFKIKLVNVNEKVVKLEIWDTAGQEKYRSVLKMYIKGAAGAFLVYDITSRDTFSALTMWNNSLREFAGPNVVVTLIGNRKDLDAQREVTFLEGSTFAKNNDMLFLETSAMSGENVEEAFLQCTRVILAEMGSSRKQVVASSITDHITHTITASDDRKGAVEGLTVHGNELFIVRYEQHKLQGQSIIDIYDATYLTFKRNLQIDQLYGRARGLTSCDTNNCLYVSCWCGDGYIVRVELTGNNEVVRWKVEDNYWPRGLSINRQHNLVVTCNGTPNKLIEYTTRGDLVREILFPDDVVCAHHAIQLDSSQFLVCHGGVIDAVQQVRVIDINGLVVRCYGNERGSETGQLNGPRHLVIYRNGAIFVADYENKRIVVLDSTLNWSHDLQLDGANGLTDVKPEQTKNRDVNRGFFNALKKALFETDPVLEFDNQQSITGINKPYFLFLDEQRNRLFVGEWNEDDSRVLVVKI